MLNFLETTSTPAKSRCRYLTAAEERTTFALMVSNFSSVLSPSVWENQVLISGDSEYSELDLSVAAEMAVHAQSLQRPGVNPPPVFPPNPAFPAPSQFPQAQPQPQTAIPALSNPSQIAQLISSLDGPTLQSLLGALQQAQTASQPTQQPFPAMQTGNPVDLASLLSNATRQPNQMPPVHSQPPSQPIPTQPFGMPVQQQNAPVVPDPNLISLLAKGLGGGKPPQNQAAVAPQVQNIVNQLAKWKQ